MIRRTQFLLPVLSILLCQSPEFFSMQQHTGRQQHTERLQTLEQCFLASNFNDAKQIVTSLYEVNDPILCDIWLRLIDIAKGMRTQNEIHHLQNLLGEIESIVEFEIGNVRRRMETLAQERNTFDLNLQAFNHRLQEINRNIEAIIEIRLEEDEINNLFQQNEQIQAQAIGIQEQRTQAIRNADEVYTFIKRMQDLNEVITFSVQLLSNNIENTETTNIIGFLLQDRDYINNLQKTLETTYQEYDLIRVGFFHLLGAKKLPEQINNLILAPTTSQQPQNPTPTPNPELNPTPAWNSLYAVPQEKRQKVGQLVAEFNQPLLDRRQQQQNQGQPAASAATQPAASDTQSAASTTQPAASASENNEQNPQTPAENEEKGEGLLDWVTSLFR